MIMSEHCVQRNCRVLRQEFVRPGIVFLERDEDVQ